MAQETDTSIDAQWARIRGKLKAEFGEAAFKSWLKPLTLVSIDRGEIKIAVPTRFMRDWVRSHYADRIRALWSMENRAVRSVEIVVQASPPRAEPSAGGRLEAVRGGRPVTQIAPRTSPQLEIAPAATSEDREDFGAPLDPRFTFENWVVGKSNEFATAAARRVADEAKVPFNPLFLYGGVGLGKTHLMHAIAWHIRRRHPQRRVIYLSAEKFMYQFIRALRFKDTMAFKEQFRSVDVLMIDDVQFISGKDSTQEEFFHTFNALVDQNRQIVLSADKSPTDLEGLEERVRSRLGWGLVADIHPTTYELRLGILQSKSEQLGVVVPPKVLEFLAHKITSNIRELEGALNRIVAHAQLVGRPITLESAQEVLHDLLRANDRRVTIEEIQKRVAEHYSIRLADMHSPRRARAVARPRQVAMYLAKQLTSRSLPEIGRKFGGRDHTTVMHAVRKIEELRATDQSFSEDIELLRRMLEA
ncbi:MAG TPA: chromosomal replication initiator protein DnaA [Alphaproteobacteria bacterium]